MTTAQTDKGVELVDVDAEAGIIIQSLMFRHRETQLQLAPVLGVSQASLSRKLRGSVSFSLAELYKIGRHYNVAPADLLPRLDSNQQPFGYRLSLVSTTTSSSTKPPISLSGGGWSRPSLRVV